MIMPKKDTDKQIIKTKTKDSTKIIITTTLLLILLMISIIGLIIFNYQDQMNTKNNIIEILINISDKQFNDNQQLLIINKKHLTTNKDFNSTITTQHSLIELYESQIIIKDNIIETKTNEFNQKVGLILNPTTKQVLTFIKKDKTDKFEWTTDYDCTSFSNTLVKNALSNGIFGCVVELDADTDNDNISDSGHMLVAFNTTDRGVIYIEPQNDKIVDLYNGLNYWCTFYDDCEDYIILKTISCYT